jgi:hypothetical protein
VRRSRFESIVGLVCVAVVLLTGLPALYRGVFRPQILRWRFLRCEAERARAHFVDLYRSSPGMARELMVDVDELEIHIDAEGNTLLRNTCGHRLYVTAFLENDLAELDRLRGEPAPPAHSPGPLRLGGLPLDAGAIGRFAEIVRIGCAGGPRAEIRDIPVGGFDWLRPLTVGGGSICGCFSYADGHGRKTALPRLKGKDVSAAE